jgi:hypothetical protein
MKDQKTPKHDPAPENDQTAVLGSSSASCSAFPGKLIEHRAADLNHSLYVLFWRATYEARWQGSCTYDSIEAIRSNYAWVWDGGYEVRLYQVELPTGATSLQNVIGQARRCRA